MNFIEKSPVGESIEVPGWHSCASQLLTGEERFDLCCSVSSEVHRCSSAVSCFVPRPSASRTSSSGSWCRLAPPHQRRPSLPLPTARGKLRRMHWNVFTCDLQVISTSLMSVMFYWVMCVRVRQDMPLNWWELKKLRLCFLSGNEKFEALCTNSGRNWGEPLQPKETPISFVTKFHGLSVNLQTKP